MENENKHREKAGEYGRILFSWQVPEYEKYERSRSWYIIAIELMCAAQAYDLVTENNPLEAGVGTRAAHRVIRRHVPYFEKDRDLYRDIEKIAALLRSGEIIRAVEDEIGEIKGWAARWP